MAAEAQIVPWQPPPLNPSKMWYMRNDRMETDAVVQLFSDTHPFAACPSVSRSLCCERIRAGELRDQCKLLVKCMKWAETCPEDGSRAQRLEELLCSFSIPHTGGPCQPLFQAIIGTTVAATVDDVRAMMTACIHALTQLNSEAALADLHDFAVALCASKRADAQNCVLIGMAIAVPGFMWSTTFLDKFEEFVAYASVIPAGLEVFKLFVETAPQQALCWRDERRSWPIVLLINWYIFGNAGEACTVMKRIFDRGGASCGEMRAVFEAPYTILNGALQIVNGFMQQVPYQVRGLCDWLPQRSDVKRVEGWSNRIQAIIVEADASSRRYCKELGSVLCAALEQSETSIPRVVIALVLSYTPAKESEIPVVFTFPPFAVDP